MPFISKERVAEIRNQIKKEFPEFKFSIRLRDHMSVNVNILAGPIEMITNPNRRNEEVNEFYIAEHYKDFPKVRDVLLKVYKIMNEGNYITSVDGDYGSIPSFYTHLEIGDWDKPYMILDK
jgi:hypothetical protein